MTCPKRHQITSGVWRRDLHLWQVLNGGGGHIESIDSELDMSELVREKNELERRLTDAATQSSSWQATNSTQSTQSDYFLVIPDIDPRTMSDVICSGLLGPASCWH